MHAIRFIRVTSAALAVFSWATVAQGQARLPDVGDRVRVTFPCESARTGAACRDVGQLTGFTSDSLRVRTDGTTNTYALEAIRGLEVSRGRRSRWKIGAAAGFGVGAAAAAVVVYSGGSTALCNQSANQDAIGTGECVGLILGAGVAGGGLGALIGSFIRVERWERVPFDRVRMGLTPQSGGGQRLAISIAF